MATENVVSNGAKPTVKTREVKVTLADQEDTLIVNEEVLTMLASAFDLQDDYENQSKFIRAFVFDAVNGQLKVFCSKKIQDWERAIHKLIDKHPTYTKEQAIAALLENKKAKQLYDYAQLATEIRSKLR